MFYLLPLHQTIGLGDGFKAQGIVTIRSAKLDLSPRATGTNNIDNTSINVLGRSEENLLHISIRRRENAIVLLGQGGKNYAGG